MNKKIIASVLAVAFAFSMAGPVGAITDAEYQTLLDQLADLTALYNTLLAQTSVPTTSATAVCFDADLSKGMTSNDVENLQIVLNKNASTQVASSGAGSPGNETTYFGSLTLAAVKTFQTSNGIINTGYVGPLTRGALNALYCTPVVPAVTYPAGCTSAVGFSTTTGDPCSGAVSYPAGCTSAVGFSPTTGDPCSTVVTYPEGCTSAVGYSPTTGDPCSGTPVAGPTEGYFTFKQLASPANATSAKEGTTNTAVLAFTLKANNSDINLKTIKLGFDNRPWRYISKISLYDGSNLLREVVANSSAFEEVTVGNSYNLYLSSLDISILKGETKTFTFKVDVPASPDTSGTVTLTLAANAIRGVDTIGLNVYAAAGETRTFTTAAGTTGALELSINNGAITDKVELISETDTTEHVTLAKFDLKAKYNDIHITEINNVTLVDHASNTLDAVVLAAELWDGDTMLGSVTPTATGTIADFTDLDIDIVKDATKTLTIKASVAAIGASATKEGDYTNVTLTASKANIVCEDSLYNDITATGSLTGKYVYFYTVAPIWALVKAEISQIGDATVGYTANAEIVFTVTAQGGDVYIAKTLAYAAAANNVISVDRTTLKGGELEGSLSVSPASPIAGSFGYKVGSGETRTFTINGFIPVGTAAVGGFAGMKVNGISWGIVDEDTDPDTYSTFLLEDFVTTEVYVSSSTAT